MHIENMGLGSRYGGVVAILPTMFYFQFFLQSVPLVDFSTLYFRRSWWKKA